MQHGLQIEKIFEYFFIRIHYSSSVDNVGGYGLEG